MRASRNEAPAANLLAQSPITPSQTTPVNNPATTPATTLAHEGGLRSRMEGAATSMKQLGGRVALPIGNAMKGLANSSAASAVGAAVTSVLKPPATLAANVVSTLHQGVVQSSRPSLSSRPLQQALQGNMADPAHQMAAHEQVVNYGRHSATMGERLLPFAHGVARLSIAGTSPAFGVGRNAGMMAGDAAGRAESNRPQATGVFAGPQRPGHALTGKELGQMAGTGLQQWMLGSMTGAMGNMVGQHVIAPLVNKISVQFNAIPERAILPQQVEDDMNTLKPGSGTELLDHLRAMQKDVAAITSNSNVRLGQIAFDTVTAARFAAMGGTPLGMAGQVGFGLAVSATAGAMIGGVIAIRQAQSTIQIPDAAELRAAAQAHPDGNPEALANVKKNDVPLFFAKHTVPPVEQANATPVGAEHQTHLGQIGGCVSGALNTVGRTMQSIYHAIERPFVNGPLMEPLPTNPSVDAHPGGRLGRTMQTISNVGASAINRAGHMAAATMMTSTASTVSNMLAAATDGPAKNAVLAIGNAIGIHAAIKPWFNALASGIPAGDNAIHADRQQQVNLQAAELQQNAFVDLEAGHGVAT